MHVLRNQGWDFGGGIADNIKERDDIWPPCQVLEDLDLTFDFLLLHRLENLDNALLFIDDVNALENLAFQGRLARAITQDATRLRTSEYFPLPTFLTIS